MRMPRLLFAIGFVALFICGCDAERSTAPPLEGDGDTVEGESGEGAEAEAEKEALVYTRPERGEALSQAEIDQATETYLELLSGTRYFETLDERLHGWPESDPAGYWYGTWWSGVTVSKSRGRVTYLHNADGSDNNAMRTAPMLSGTAFAYRLWQKPAHAKLLRKLLRGFNAWVLAMEVSDVSSPTLMTRAHYTTSFLSSDGGRDLVVDFSLNRPGKDNGATSYVHIPDNPYWGDIWVKNMRSKDDIGHIYQAIPMLYAAAAMIPEAGFSADFAQFEELYRAWSLQVEKDGFKIATYDKELKVYLPDDELAVLIDYRNLECTLILALRLFGHEGDPGAWNCGSGISDIDAFASIKPDNAQLMRSFHEAGAAMARWAGKDEMAKAMLAGLAARIDKILDARESADPPANPIDQDLAELILMSAQVGLPLTWREVRFLHARIKEAHAAYLAEARRPFFHLFEKSTPDGAYDYDLDLDGIFFRYIGTVLEACASPYVNPASKPLLNCERVKAWGLSAEVGGR